jgi:hypothetical protein
MKNSALVFLGLLLGGAVATVATRSVFAQGDPPPAPRPRWQQYCEPAASIQEASTLASARGADGWELVSFSSGALCFKRPASASRGDVAWPGY